MSLLDRSARSAEETLRVAFEEYRRRFQEITSRAQKRFEERDWAGGQRDATERLALYARVVEGVVLVLEEKLGSELRSRTIWRAMRDAYSDSIAAYADIEIAETFFNSVTRRVFRTVGVDPRIEYVDLDIRRAHYGPGVAAHRTWRDADTRSMVAEVLAAHAFDVPFEDAERDARLVAAEIERCWAHGPVEKIDVIESTFYRGSGAYLVGRVRGGRARSPLVLVLVHGAGGVKVDAVLMDESEVSIVFSYTRSHFLVEATHPSNVVQFLKTLTPRKPLAELYIALGYSKHGKSELYRDLLGHLGRSLGRFVHARGVTGMVMIVFTLPSFPYVFKVIRDEFAYPKTNTPEYVRNRYKLVFGHDRAGRLIEAQEFEHLRFERRRFAPELLEELASAAQDNVTVEGEDVAIHHLYLERRVTPLDLYLREADEGAARRMVLDYGQAIRDLARTNIFPGDLLLKNFGVTRHGRVTFYDYDELCLVTECNFRDLPQARGAEEEVAAEPWFYVGEDDVFPEEFIQFLGLSKALRDVFMEEHAEVMTADFWRGLQQRHRDGEVLDVFPYPPWKRLRNTERDRTGARA